VIDRFARDFYGSMTDSINAGERSDRFTVAWHLRREPGPRAIRAPTVDLLTRTDDQLPGPVPSGSGPGQAAVIEVPREYHDLRAADPVLATVWRDAIADAVEGCLGAGMAGVTFDRDRSAYVFATPEAIEGGL
jgi:predicted GNAT superfamily acetyltransferase